MPRAHTTRTALFALCLALLGSLSTPALAGGAAGEGQGERRAEAAEPQVILYATAWCGWCRKTRELLKELGVEYADKDIEKSPEAAREHREKAGRGAGVPVLDIGGTVVRGYNEKRIRELVAELQRGDRNRT